MRQENKRVLVILRGVSGSGKSFLAESLLSFIPVSGKGAGVECNADSFFYDEKGNYNFDVAKLGWAHNQCWEKFKKAVDTPDVDFIIQSNTNTQEKEFKKYKDYAEAAGLVVFIVVVENRHGGKKFS